MKREPSLPFRGRWERRRLLISRRPWTQDEHRQAVALWREGKTIPEIAECLKRSGNSVSGRIQGERTAFPRRTAKEFQAIQKRMHPILDTRHDDTLFDEPNLEKERKRLGEEFAGKPLRVLVLSDLHVPFHHAEVLRQALREDADLCLLAGDIMDSYAVSRFMKYKNIPLARELAETGAVLELLAKTFRRVICLQGNHDVRSLRKLTVLLSESHPDLYQILKPATNLLESCAQGLANVTVMNGWWLQLGQVIFCHRERYMKQERSLGEATVRYFENLGKTFELIITGHTHRQVMLPIRRRTWYIENPACAYRQDYTRESHSPALPISMGYSIIQLDAEGRVKINQCRIQFVGWE